MSHLQYKSYGGYGDFAKKQLHYSQAVRIGDVIEISGQGAWDRETGANFPREISDQVEQAFANVEHTLRLAGAEGWDAVFKIHSYHVGMTSESLEAVAACLKKYCKNHEPLWTAIGVEKLAFPEMKIEIEVRAHIKS